MLPPLSPCWLDPSVAGSHGSSSPLVGRGRPLPFSPLGTEYYFSLFEILINFEHFACQIYSISEHVMRDELIHLWQIDCTCMYVALHRIFVYVIPVSSTGQN